MNQLIRELKPKSIMDCCFCKQPIEVERDTIHGGWWLSGCNALPVKHARCCHDCDWEIVLPARYEWAKENNHTRWSEGCLCSDCERNPTVEWQLDSANMKALSTDGHEILLTEVEGIDGLYKFTPDTSPEYAELFQERENLNHEPD